MKICRIVLNIYLFISIYGGNITAKAKWNYADNGHSWSHLCKTGKWQSPIDIKRPFYSSAVQVKLAYTDFKNGVTITKQQALLEDVYNTGHSIQVNGDAGEMIFGSHHFEVRQFHFHAPSEHTFNGKHYPLEMHIVHEDQFKNVAVLAIIFEESSKENLFLKRLEWEQLPKIQTHRKVSSPLSLSYFDTDKAHYLVYNGSFTTPPCTEGVQWFILQNKFPISRQQIVMFPSFNDAPHGTYRSTKPLNHRVVKSL